jgi:hypothetical protein
LSFPILGELFFLDLAIGFFVSFVLANFKNLPKQGKNSSLLLFFLETRLLFKAYIFMR